jgi:signal transduction histidine kinase
MILTIILLTALINIVLGVISYNKNPKSATHRLLTSLTIIFALWSIANYFSLNSSTSEDTLFWIRAVMFITAPLGPVLYLFIKTFPNAEFKINKKFLYVLTYLTIFVMAIAFTPLLFSGVTIAEQITPTPGPGILLFAFLFVGMPLLGFIELIKKYRRSQGIEKLQLKYLIAGISETFALLILTNFIAVIVFRYSGFVIFGPMFSLILVGFITYAIIRHRLLEVRIILARSVLYTILIILIAGMYAFGVYLVSQYIFRFSINTQRMVIYTVLALFVAFTLSPLRGFIEGLTNKIFFKGKYNPNTLAFQLTNIIASTISLNDLTRKTLKKLISELRITHGAFVIYSGRKFTIYPQGASHYEHERKTIDALYNLKRLTIFDEEKNNKVKEIMRILDVAVIMPLFERSEKTGILLLGEKKTGQIYSQQDITVLGIFGSAISIAIQNAKSYEAIRNFNVTLKEEVQRATKDLKNANIKLKDLSKQKDDFIAMASHELKTPVTSIKLYMQLLHRKFQKLKDVKSAESIAKMDGQVNKLINLINDLLDVSKVEEGKLQFNTTAFNLNDLVSEIVEEMQRTTKHKIVVVQENVEEVYGDRDRIGQVLTNFISNAIKYSPNAERLSVATTKNKKEAIVKVQDFGIGLSQKEKDKVFDRFYRAGERKDSFPGLGLGLYISSEIIHRHKGRIWVESAKGKGSSFYFSLPLSKTAN